MLDQNTKSHIEEEVESGRLPRRAPRTVLGGTSNGTVCAACGRAITPGAIEMETAAEDDQSRFYHYECYEYTKRPCDSARDA